MYYIFTFIFAFQEEMGMFRKLNTTQELIRWDEKNSKSGSTCRDRILFIDDDPTVLDTTKLLLEHLGYDVVSAMSPFEAVEKFQSQTKSFDLVITDLKMPGMDGIELSRKLLEQNPRIPIIICSGSCSMVNESEMKDLGIKGLISKPFSIRKSANFIEGIIGEARMQQ
jgi:CheY-like chemotaxis protein